MKRDRQWETKPKKRIKTQFGKTRSISFVVKNKIRQHIISTANIDLLVLVNVVEKSKKWKLENGIGNIKIFSRCFRKQNIQLKKQYKQKKYLNRMDGHKDNIPKSTSLIDANCN